MTAAACGQRSDLTDEEWAEIAPFLPPAKPGGNKRKVNLREVANGLDVHPQHRLSVACNPEGPGGAQHSA